MIKFQIIVQKEPILLVKKKKISRLEFFETVVANRFLIKKNKVYTKSKKGPMAVFAHEPISHKIFVYKYYELEELEDTVSLLELFGINPKNIIAIDVGANIGNHSVFFAQHFYQVLSFEPNQTTYKILEFNLGFYENAHPFNTALSSFNGYGDLWVQESNPGRSSLAYIHKGSSANTVKIQKLDDYQELILSKKSDIGLIKLDVEGLENDVILGAKEIIKAHRPVITFEQRIQEFNSGEAETLTVRLLRSLEYVILSVDDSRKRVNPLVQLVFALLFGREIERRFEICEYVKKANYPTLFAIPKEYLTRLK